VLLAFHSGRHLVHIDEMMGIGVSLDFHFHPPDLVRRLLEDAGLTVDCDLRRQPAGSEVQTERCYLLARRTGLTLRPATELDREFLRALHHACYRSWVEPIWGWDQADQDRRFDRAFGVAGRVIVEFDAEPIGTLKTSRIGGSLSVDDIEVAPQHQSRGMGSRLLRGVLAEADRESIPVRLQVLRTNPARRLYERLGFTVERETDSHVLMVRPARES
jgi:ribosomal protein S18 acetylase RimI-like enzyme